MSTGRLRAEFEALCDSAAPVREARLHELARGEPQLAARLRDLLAHDADRLYLERSGLLRQAGPVAGRGQRLGRFELLRPLGSGGMGAVWEAVQHDPERRVAIKLLAQATRSEGERWRFAHEVEVLASLNHPAIATFFEAGTTALGGTDVAWLAMELVLDARDVLAWADDEKLALDERLAVFLRLCDAVAHGHRRGVLHRDLKPSNVLVGRDGTLKLIDFGIARVAAIDGEREWRTMTGELVGTLQYMAPEQLQGRPEAIGPACDVWALGVILYQLLCGEPPFPFAGKPLTEITRMVLGDEPRPPWRSRPGLPVDLGWIILRALAKDSLRRYATVDALVADLHCFQRRLPVTARAPGLGYRAARFVQRHRVGVSVSALIAAALVVGGVGLWQGREDARSGERLALAGRAEARRGELIAQAAQKVAEAAQAEARDREQAARRAEARSRAVLQITNEMFEGIKDTEASRDLAVHELLDAAVLDARVTRDPAVEQDVRSVRGTAFDRLHRFERARTEWERAMELAEQLQAAGGDATAVQQALERRQIAAASLGRILVRLGERDRGLQLLRTAVAATGAGVAADTRIRVLTSWCRLCVEDNLDVELSRATDELALLAKQTGNRSLSITADGWAAKAASMLGDHDRAIVAAERAWHGAREWFGPEHDYACEMLARYVTVLHEAGDLTRSEALYPQLLLLTRKTFGGKHKNLLQVMNNQAHLLMAHGKRAAAIATMREIVATYEARGTAMDKEHLMAAHNLGMVLNLSGAFAEAEPLLRSASTASRSLLGPDDPEAAMMRFNHGACLAWSKRLAEAEPILLAEHGNLRRLLPAGHQILVRASRTVGDAYAANGRLDAAEQWRRK